MLCYECGGIGHRRSNHRKKKIDKMAEKRIEKKDKKMEEKIEKQETKKDKKEKKMKKMKKSEKKKIERKDIGVETERVEIVEKKEKR